MAAAIKTEFDRLGRFFVAEYQSRVPPGATKGKFPGDGPPSGRLKRAVRYRRPYLTSKGRYTITLYINRGEVREYWHVHEHGMVIKARKGYMIFDYQGKRWRKKTVRIKRKAYIQESIDATLAEVERNTPNHIRDFINITSRM